MQDFQSLQVGSVAALQPGTRLAQPLCSRAQTGRIPQLEVAPAHSTPSVNAFASGVPELVACVSSAIPLSLCILVDIPQGAGSHTWNKSNLQQQLWA